ncbi:dUTP diphosphatase, partial [Enterococcus faecalis]
KPILVKTGIKAYMPDSEYFELVSRSSNPLKRFLLLANGVGVIDSDYYNNENNKGHIMFQFLNFGYEDVVIEKGERIG